MHALPKPKDPTAPWPAPDAAYVDFARGTLGLGVFAIVASVVVGGVFVYVLVDYGATFSGAGLAALIFWAVVFLAAGLLIGVLSTFHALTPSGLAVDASGVWYIRRRRGILVPWQQVRAVGGSYWIRRVHRAGDMVIRAVTTDEGREYQAIEVFLRDDTVVKADRRLRGRWFDQQEAEAAPGLVGGRLRFIFAGRTYGDFADSVRRHVPELWFGEYRRDRAA